MKKIIFSVAFIAAMGFVASTNAQEIISQDLVNLKTDVATVKREINTLPPMNVNSNPVLKNSVITATNPIYPYSFQSLNLPTGQTPEVDAQHFVDDAQKKRSLGMDAALSGLNRDTGWSGKEGKVAATEIYDFKSSDKAKGKLKPTKDFHSSKSNNSKFNSDTNKIQKRQ